MLRLVIPELEFFDETSQEFITVPAYDVELEHSLVSLSKWEQIWEVPFLGRGEKTDDETISYVECMCLTPDVPSEVFLRLGHLNMQKVSDYISKKATATFFSDVKSGPGSRDVITSEVIYHWMIALQIPFECQYWHLNRLIALIRVCSAKNAPAKKMSTSEVLARNRALNAQRKVQLGTTG